MEEKDLRQMIAEDKAKREAACLAEFNQFVGQLQEKYQCVILPVVTPISEGNMAMARIIVKAQ